jgi:TRAP-type C4-dicarboxylate transport system permease small subunit
MAESAPGGEAPAPESTFGRAIYAAAGVLAVLAGLLLVALTLLVTADVLGRLPGRLGGTWLFRSAIPALFGPVDAYSLGFTLPWTTEVTEYALYWLTFLGAPWVLKEGGHISIDIVTQRLSDGARAKLWRLVALLGAIIAAILLYYSVAVLFKSIAEKTMIVRTLTVSESWIFAPLPACVLLMLLIFARWIVHPPAQHREVREGP